MEQQVPLVDIDASMWPDRGRGGRVDRARSAAPAALIPALARVGGTLRRRSAALQQHAQHQMTTLCSARFDRDQIEAFADEFIRYSAWRSESRRHPTFETTMRVDGIEHFKQFVDRGRPAIMTFVHHGPWDGAIASIIRLGVPMSTIASRAMASPDGPRHVHDVRRKALVYGGYLFDLAEGMRGIQTRLEQGRVVGIAVDAHGGSPATFMGKSVRSAGGAAAAAWALRVPVVTWSCERDGRGKPYVVVHPALDPGEFESRPALHDAIVAHHEPAVERWPAAYEDPTRRWRFVDEEGSADVDHTDEPDV